MGPISQTSFWDQFLKLVSRPGFLGIWLPPCLSLSLLLSLSLSLRFTLISGWSEGSELSQLIVHSQLQIELLVLLFPPSHYCT